MGSKVFLRCYWIRIAFETFEGQAFIYLKMNFCPTVADSCSVLAKQCYFYMRRIRIGLLSMQREVNIEVPDAYRPRRSQFENVLIPSCPKIISHVYTLSTHKIDISLTCQFATSRFLYVVHRRLGIEDVSSDVELAAFRSNMGALLRNKQH